MSDSPVVEQLREFVAERDWQQFHTTENLAKSISIESAELLECFQWGGDADETRIREELGDVLIYCYLLADRIGQSPIDLISAKLTINIGKYPVEKSRGRSTKYTDL